MVNPVQVVWFKRDLRVVDHAAFNLAVANGPVLPLYCIEPDLWRQKDASQRHWRFIRDSLQDLHRALLEKGGGLVLRKGEMIEVLQSLAQQYPDFVLWSHEETGNGWSFSRDRKVALWCREFGITWHEIPSHGVVRRLSNRNEWSHIRHQRMSGSLLRPPDRIDFVKNVVSDALPNSDDLWCGQPIIGNTQLGGRREGLKTLETFLRERGRKYLATLSRPGVSARHCSRLSAHIAYGSLSVREIIQATRSRLDILAGNNDIEAVSFAKNLSAFLSRLAWRCHFVQKLEQQPSIETRCMHPAFEGMRDGYFREDFFTAWQEGLTGYPIIDACMRSLRENGWINFRMRAMLVSFASYHLWLDWRETAPVLARLFTDYEPGIHYAQFQMQSGVTGINIPRIYNPVKQSLDQDPQGKFIRRYVPELKDIPESFLHEPWRYHYPPSDYPEPIVRHEPATQFARSMLQRARQQAGFREDAERVYQKLGSRQKQVVSSIETRQLELFDQ